LTLLNRTPPLKHIHGLLLLMLTSLPYQRTMAGLVLVLPKMVGLTDYLTELFLLKIKTVVKLYKFYFKYKSRWSNIIKALLVSPLMAHLAV
jgi:hypothetical protein